LEDYELPEVPAETSGSIVLESKMILLVLQLTQKIIKQSSNPHSTPETFTPEVSAGTSGD
jgi:hypothetical protein